MGCWQFKGSHSQPHISRQGWDFQSFAKILGAPHSLAGNGAPLGLATESAVTVISLTDDENEVLSH